MKKRSYKVQTKIWCNETGFIYNSVKEASEKTGVNASAISQQMKGNRNNVGGLTFKKINVEEMLNEIQKYKDIIADIVTVEFNKRDENR